MSDTPRTDDVMRDAARDWNTLPRFARQLERELNETRSELDETKRQLCGMRDMLHTSSGELGIARSDIAELNERLIDRQKTLMAALTENQNLKRELAKRNQA